MFGLKRLFRMFFAMITGRTNKISDKMATNEHVIAATFDASIENLMARERTVTDAVARIMSIAERHAKDIESLKTRAERNTHVKNAAAAKAKALAAVLKSQGLSDDEVKLNPQYIQHRAAFTDNSSTLVEVEKQLKEKETELVSLKAEIETYKIQLQQMQRDRKSLLLKKESTLVKATTAKEKIEANQMLTGLSENSIDKDLLAVESAVDTLVTKSKVTAELAGNDAERNDQEYLNYASQIKDNSEFDSLTGLGQEPVNIEVGKLPE